MSLEANKLIATRFLQAWSAGGTDVVDELAAPDIVVSYTHFAKPVRGADAFKEVLAQTYACFPDIRIEAEEVMAEGDRVMVRWTYRATHQAGELFGAVPEGRAVHVSGVTIYRVAGGRIVEERGVVDNLSLLLQLGAIPA